jgi:hypothetical protein
MANAFPKPSRALPAKGRGRQAPHFWASILRERKMAAKSAILCPRMKPPFGASAGCGQGWIAGEMVKVHKCFRSKSNVVQGELPACSPKEKQPSTEH